MGFIPKYSEAIETSSSFIQDADVRVVAAAWNVFDFNGKGKKTDHNPTGANLALALTVRPLAAETEEEDETYQYTGSYISKFAPSETADGTPLTEVGQAGQYVVLAEGSTASGFLKNTDLMTFLKELSNAQFPEDRIPERADGFVGMEGHIKRVPQKKKDGTVSLNAKGYENTLPIFTRILKFPWEKAKGTAPAAKGGAKPVVATKTTVATASTYKPEDLAIRYLSETLASSTTAHTPAELKKSAFGWSLIPENFLPSKVKPDPATRKAFCELLINDEFLLSKSAAADADSVYNVVQDENSVVTSIVPLTAAA